MNRERVLAALDAASKRLDRVLGFGPIPGEEDNLRGLIERLKSAHQSLKDTDGFKPDPLYYWRLLGESLLTLSKYNCQDVINALHAAAATFYPATPAVKPPFFGAEEEVIRESETPAQATLRLLAPYLASLSDALREITPADTYRTYRLVTTGLEAQAKRDAEGADRLNNVIAWAWRRRQGRPSLDSQAAAHLRFILFLAAGVDSLSSPPEDREVAEAIAWARAEGEKGEATHDPRIDGGAFPTPGTPFDFEDSSANLRAIREQVERDRHRPRAGASFTDRTATVKEIAGVPTRSALAGILLGELEEGIKALSLLTYTSDTRPEEALRRVSSLRALIDELAEDYAHAQVRERRYEERLENVIAFLWRRYNESGASHAEQAIAYFTLRLAVGKVRLKKVPDGAELAGAEGFSHTGFDHSPNGLGLFVPITPTGRDFTPKGVEVRQTGGPLFDTADSYDLARRVADILAWVWRRLNLQPIEDSERHALNTVLKMAAGFYSLSTPPDEDTLAAALKQAEGLPRFEFGRVSPVSEEAIKDAGHGGGCPPYPHTHNADGSTEPMRIFGLPVVFAEDLPRGRVWLEPQPKAERVTDETPKRHSFDYVVGVDVAQPGRESATVVRLESLRPGEIKAMEAALRAIETVRTYTVPPLSPETDVTRALSRLETYARGIPLRVQRAYEEGVEDGRGYASLKDTIDARLTDFVAGRIVQDGLREELQDARRDVARTEAARQEVIRENVALQRKQGRIVRLIGYLGGGYQFLANATVTLELPPDVSAAIESGKAVYEAWVAEMSKGGARQGRGK